MKIVMKKKDEELFTLVLLETGHMVDVPAIKGLRSGTTRGTDDWKSLSKMIIEARASLKRHNVEHPETIAKYFAWLREKIDAAGEES